MEVKSGALLPLALWVHLPVVKGEGLGSWTLPCPAHPSACFAGGPPRPRGPCAGAREHHQPPGPAVTPLPEQDPGCVQAALPQVTQMTRPHQVLRRLWVHLSTMFFLFVSSGSPGAVLFEVVLLGRRVLARLRLVFPTAGPAGSGLFVIVASKGGKKKKEKGLHRKAVALRPCCAQPCPHGCPAPAVY